MVIEKALKKFPFVSLNKSFDKRYHMAYQFSFSLESQANFSVFNNFSNDAEAFQRDQIRLAETHRTVCRGCSFNVKLIRETSRGSSTRDMKFREYLEVFFLHFANFISRFRHHMSSLFARKHIKMSEGVNCKTVFGEENKRERLS